MSQNAPRQPTPEVMADIKRLIAGMQRGKVIIAVMNGGITAIHEEKTLDIAHLGDLHIR